MTNLPGRHRTKIKKTRTKLPHKLLYDLFSYLQIELWLLGRMQYFVWANSTETHISAVIYGSLDELFNVLNLIWFYIFMIPQVWILKCSLWLSTVFWPFQMRFRAFNIGLIYCYIPILPYIGTFWYHFVAYHAHCGTMARPPKTEMVREETFSTCSTQSQKSFKDKDCLIQK